MMVVRACIGWKVEVAFKCSPLLTVVLLNIPSTMFTTVLAVMAGSKMVSTITGIAAVFI